MDIYYIYTKQKIFFDIIIFLISFKEKKIQAVSKRYYINTLNNSKFINVL